MSTSFNEAEVTENYATKSDFELKKEYHEIRKIPEARTNIVALQKMTILMAEFEKRGLEMPGNRPAYVHQEAENSGPNFTSIAIGAVLAIGGIIASGATDRVFYGAILVGIFMVGKGFIRL